MNPVRPDMTQPATNATVRHSPDWANERATPPPADAGLTTSVAVKNTTTTSGSRMSPIVLN